MGFDLRKAFSRNITSKIKIWKVKKRDNKS